jgi:hypothetical protein
LSCAHEIRQLSFLPFNLLLKRRSKRREVSKEGTRVSKLAHVT